MQAYTVEQVAKLLNVGRDKVYYLLRTKQLRSIKIGKLRRITDAQLAEFIASLEAADQKGSRRPERRPLTASYSNVLPCYTRRRTRPAREGPGSVRALTTQTSMIISAGLRASI
ncbi:MAG: helix-turn-helix domain-containing protein [Mycobacteriaceae bacterium]